MRKIYKLLVITIIGMIITFLLVEIGNSLLENYNTGFYYFLGQLLTTVGLLRKIAGEVKFQLGLNAFKSFWNSLDTGFKVILISALVVIFWKFMKFLFTNRN